jgi:hypothetical protein
MAKQTFTTGQVLTAAQMTSLQQTAMLGGDTTAKTASYVLVAADAGTTVAMNAAGATTITVNTGLFAAGDIVFIQNRGAGTCTITAGTATVATAGSLALPQHDAGILYFTSASAAVFYEFVQSGSSTSSFTGCRIFNSTTQTINNATVTTLTFDSEVFDTSNFHSTSSNTSRITIPTGLGGYYALQASIYFSIGNGAGTRGLAITKNGTRIFGMDISGQTDQTLNFGDIANLVAGDYLEFTAYQTSGSSNGAYGDAAYTFLSAQYLGV